MTPPKTSQTRSAVPRGTGMADPGPRRDAATLAGEAPATAGVTPAGPEAPAVRMGANPVRAAGIKMSEAELDSQIRHILRDLPQILRYHTHDSRRSPGGFPDLVLVGPRGVLYRELKTATGKLSSAQDTWLMQLKAAHQNMDVWRPEDLLSGRVARELAALAGFGSPP